LEDEKSKKPQATNDEDDEVEQSIFKDLSLLGK
jgi:hypothetical protein